MKQRNMTETEYLACKDPNPMLEFFHDKAGDRKLRLFACACVRRLGPWVEDTACHTAVGIAERFADSLADPAELQFICRALGEVGYEAGRAETLLAGQRQEEARQWLRDSVQVVTMGLFRTATPVAELARELTWHAADIEIRLGVGEELMQTIWEPLDWNNDPFEVAPLEKCPESLLIRRAQADCLRDIFGNPFRPLPPRPEAIAPLAEQIYAGAWDQMPILGEWLQEHGYWSEGEHCLDPSIHHVKGCWVVDWVTGRE
jgi:hypothetical protein